MTGIYGGDDHQCAEVIEHGQREQEHAQPGRAPRGDQCQGAQGEGGVG